MARNLSAHESSVEVIANNDCSASNASASRSNRSSAKKILLSAPGITINIRCCDYQRHD